VEEWEEEDEELVGMVQVPEPPEEIVGDTVTREIGYSENLAIELANRERRR
jgi:hypothetical protein